MALLDAQALLEKMIPAAKDSLGHEWDMVSELAVSSLTTLSQNITNISEMAAHGTISVEKAQLMTDMQKSAFKTLLLSEEGLGLLAVEAALNAVIKVIRSIVNTTIGIAIL
ncbi:hypothetical protein KHS38_10085 [Mucilaginibacter sp. Bleaf8]|uniref:hypothetical protein n=1 Tax=Mucilaginibacter sp. Bleaf8 TaxID=2834430 RepID=UPI001BD090F6|nr:hypothetical protein [Mucilaginibacter sp. Bleaf8]MBS7564753.1 hypothetical protein [Mucilaginibacter sp. Bleaf8]